MNTGGLVPNRAKKVGKWKGPSVIVNIHLGYAAQDASQTNKDIVFKNNNNCL